MAGYIGTVPAVEAVQRRESFTATASQTSFATIGYTPQFLDVFLNGIHLLGDGVDYTASNSSDVVLTAGAASGDVLEVISYEPFAIADQSFSGTTTVDVLTATGAFTSVGIDDNATSTAITIDASENVLVGKTAMGTATKGCELWGDGLIIATRDSTTMILNRTSTDGSVMDLRKDNVNVGKIEVSASGASIYLGGTGAANKLDDYEEGSWTPVWSDGTNSDATYNIQVGTYIKVGTHVHLQGRVRITAIGSLSGALRINGLPFTSDGTADNLATVHIGYATNLAITATAGLTGYVSVGGARANIKVWDATTGVSDFTSTMLSADGDVFFSLEYSA